MAYTHINTIKSDGHLQSSINYITREDKTDGKTNIYAYMCNVQGAVLQFRDIRNKAMKKGNNVAHHICVAFSPEDNINPETAIEFGQRLMKEMYPDNQYVLGIHNDREHLHCHIIVNAVDMVNYKKINSNITSLYKMRGISDNLCEEYGLSVITPEFKIHRQRLKADIDKTVTETSSFYEFIKAMQDKGYEVKTGKHLAFKGVYDNQFMRCDTIGTEYSEISLKDRIINNTSSANKHKNLYDSKYVPSTKRYYLKRHIDKAIEESKDFEDFLRLMREEYEVKQGKHIAFKDKNDGSKFLRAKTIGEDYTEEMIKFRIANPEEYKDILEKRKKEEVKKIAENSHIYNKSVAVQNINARIRTLNYLSENHITSYDELIAEIEKTKKIEQNAVKYIQTFNRQISDIDDILKAKNKKRLLKPRIEQYKNADYDRYYTHQQQEELKEYNAANIFLETSTDSKLSTSELNERREETEKRKTSTEKRLIEIRDKLKTLENIKYNLETDTAERTQEQQRQEQERQEQKKAVPHRKRNDISL